MKSYPKKKPIRLKGKAKKDFRIAVGTRAYFHCEICGIYAPVDFYGEFDLHYCGHVSHIKSYGAGGGDTMDNVKWKCFSCHIEKEHGPRWSKTATAEPDSGSVRSKAKEDE